MTDNNMLKLYKKNFFLFVDAGNQGMFTWEPW